MRRLRTGAALAALLISAPVGASFTETLPQGMFMLEEAFVLSYVDTMWDNDGEPGALVEEMVRYEPGGGLQGVLTPRPEAYYYVLITKLQYGILDDLSLGIGIPVVIRTEVDPNFGWTPGDYQRQIGRSYSEDDFWAWAGSMGQQKPGSWTGNKGVLSDVVLGLRYRWTHRIPALREIGLSGALSIMAALPTGEPADPEEPVSVGTTLWDMHTQGDLCFHLGFEQRFEDALDDRLRIGLEGFYQIFFDRRRSAPKGEKHPLLLNQAPYVGERYTVNPGDFAGVSLELTVVPYKGPAWGTWLSDDDPDKAAALPPILSFMVRYTFMHLQQSDWMSDFPLWDYEREQVWASGYKNMLFGEIAISLFRLGVPLQVFASYNSLTWIPGKNARAPDIFMTGLRIPAKFW